MCTYMHTYTVLSVLSRSIVSHSLRPHGDSPGKNTGVGCLCPSPGDLPNPGIKPRSPAMEADSLPSEPPGKLMNTRVGSLSLLQDIFQAQELNQDLLHCRQILDQLSHQGSHKYIYIHVCVLAKLLQCVRLFVTLWTITH